MILFSLYFSLTYSSLSIFKYSSPFFSIFSLKSEQKGFNAKRVFNRLELRSICDNLVKDNLLSLFDLKISLKLLIRYSSYLLNLFFFFSLLSRFIRDIIGVNSSSSSSFIFSRSLLRSTKGSILAVSFSDSFSLFSIFLFASPLSIEILLIIY